MSVLSIEQLHVVSFAFKQWYFWVAKLWIIYMAKIEFCPVFANRPCYADYVFTVLIINKCYL